MWKHLKTTHKRSIILIMILYIAYFLVYVAYECIESFNSPWTGWLHKSISQVSVFPPVMPGDRLAPTCQSASFAGSSFSSSTFPTPGCHTASWHGPTGDFEWKPLVWFGPCGSHLDTSVNLVIASAGPWDWSFALLFLTLCFFSWFVLSWFGFLPEVFLFRWAWESREQESRAQLFYLFTNIWKGSFSSVAEGVYCMCSPTLWYVNQHLHKKPQ